MNDNFKIPFSANDDKWLDDEIEKAIDETDFYSDLEYVDLELGDLDE